MHNLEDALDAVGRNRGDEGDRKTLLKSIITWQTGKYIINAPNSTLQIGDVIYKGLEKENILRTLLELDESKDRNIVLKTADEYFGALQIYTEQFPYLSLNELIADSTKTPKKLSEIFVPLRAISRPDYIGLNQVDGKNLTIVDIFSAFSNQAKAPRLLIIGEPGAGKSTLLRQIAKNCWVDENHTISNKNNLVQNVKYRDLGLKSPYIPLLVRLQQLSSTRSSITPNKLMAATDLILLDPPPDNYLVAWSNTLERKWMLLLDGLDEVPADYLSNIVDWISRFAKGNPDFPLVLTSRPIENASDVDKKLNLLYREFDVYDLMPFNLAQQKEFAEKWFSGSEGKFLDEMRKLRIGDIKGTPLLLTIAAVVYSISKTHKLPERRSGLYKEFVDILGNEAISRGLRDELEDRLLKIKEDILENLAVAISQSGDNTSEFTHDYIKEFLKTELKLSGLESLRKTEDFIEIMSRRSGIFIRRGNNYDWLHLTFQEFLTARSLAKHSGIIKIFNELKKISSTSRWEQIAFFTLGLLADQGRKQQVGKLLLKIANYYENGWFSAAEAIIENIDVDNEILEQIVQRLLHYAGDSNAESSIRERAALTLRRLGRLDDTIKAWMLIVKDSYAPSGLRKKVASVLTALRFHTEANEGWLSLAQDARVHISVRKEAASNLKKVDAAKAWKSISDDKGLIFKIRYEASQKIEKLRFYDLAAEAYTSLAKDENLNFQNRQKSIDKLESMGRKREFVDALSFLLKHPDKKLDEQSRRAFIARRIAAGGDLDFFFEIDNDSRTSDFDRERLVELLRSLDRKDDLKLLARDHQLSPQFRLTAIDFLDRLGEHQEAVAILKNSFSNFISLTDILTKLARLLMRFGLTKKALEVSVIAIYSDNLGLEVRLDSVLTIEQLGDNEVLLNIVHDNKLNHNLRLRALTSIANLRLLSPLKNIVLDSTLSNELRLQAIDSLKNLGAKKELDTAGHGNSVSDQLKLALAQALLEMGEKEKAVNGSLFLIYKSKNLTIKLGSIQVINASGRFDELFHLAQDSSLPQELRGNAFNYLALNEVDDKWKAILRNRALPLRFRLLLVENLKELNLPNHLIQLINQNSIDVGLRLRALVLLQVKENNDLLINLLQNEYYPTQLRSEFIALINQIDKVQTLISIATNKKINNSFQEAAINRILILKDQDSILELVSYSRFFYSTGIQLLKKLKESKSISLLLAIAQSGRIQVGIRRQAAELLQKLISPKEFISLGLDKLGINLVQSGIKKANLPADKLPKSKIAPKLKNTSLKYKRAIDTYKKTIEGEPNNPTHYFNLGAAYRASKHYQEAIIIYQKVIDLSPNNATGYNGLGLSYTGLSQYDEAISAYQKAVLLNSSDSVIHKNLGDVFRTVERYSEASIEYDKARELGDKSVILLYKLASTYRAEGRYDDAISLYQYAIKRYPKDAQLYSGLGVVYRNLGQFDDAISAFESSLKLNPSNSSAHNGLGYTYRDTTRYEDAIIEYQKSISLDPKNVYSYMGLGSVYKSLGRFPDAVIAYQKAIQLDDMNPNGYSSLGFVYRDLGRYEDAIVHFRKSIELNPKDSYAYNGLGTVFHFLERHNEAIEAFKQSIELSADYAGCYCSLACIYNHLQRFTEASDMIRIARSLIDDDTEYMYACLESISGNLDQAIRHLEIALIKVPGLRMLASRDPLFEAIRVDPRFNELVKE